MHVTGEGNGFWKGFNNFVGEAYYNSNAFPDLTRKLNKLRQFKK
ncbi:hypothetical protein [Aliikangiella maris]